MTSLLIALIGGIIWVGMLFYWISTFDSSFPPIYQVVLALLGGAAYVGGALIAALEEM